LKGRIVAEGIHMDFVLSKLLWIVARPTNFLLAALAVSCLLALRAERRWSARMAACLALLLVALGLVPAGLWLQRPLEERFARPDPPPAEVAGIVVLGGAQLQAITTARGRLALNQHGERMIETIPLAERYPDVPIVFSGGSGYVGGYGGNEQRVNELFVAMVGLDPARVRYESRSRNTWENALETAALVGTGADRPWLLVTSAAHMPRSMGVFRKAGLDVVPWPVDDQTTGGPEFEPAIEMSARLDQFDEAVKEWIGLVAYRLMGRTDALLPGTQG